MIRYFLVFTKREKKRGLPPLSSPLLSSPLLSKALLSFPSSKKQKTLLLKKNAKKEKTRAQNKPKRDKTKQHPRAHVFKTKRKMGFLGLGRKKKSEAELLEEERLRRQSMPWYARLFGTECCGNRGGKREKKEEKKNVGA